MDTAKAVGVIINNPEFADVRSLEGVAPTKKHAVFTIAVPTTAGTAAEVTINYVITDVEKKRKFVCVDTNDIPEIAVVDPDMMSTMPAPLTAATGMDALTHAIEGLITKGAWEMSDMFHLEAIRLISSNLRDAVNNDPDGRKGMALGQYIAGMGFSNVGLGIVHSMAHGLSALYDTPHGVACAIILPTGLEYNKEYSGEKYKALAKAMGVEGVDAMTQEQYRQAAIDAVKKLSADVGIPADLKGIVKEEDVQFLAESAYADACRPGNPRDTSVEDHRPLPQPHDLDYHAQYSLPPTTNELAAGFLLHKSLECSAVGCYSLYINTIGAMQMTTEKLYYIDSHMFAFEAKVLDCRRKRAAG